MTHPVQAIVMQCLADSGWAGRRQECATREFDTAVGAKQAIVYCYPSSRGPLVIITGDYQSEGRNVLSACMELIPADANPSTVRDAAGRFNANAIAQIDASYARRLRLDGVA